MNEVIVNNEFFQLLLQHQGPLHAYVLSLVGNTTDARDLLQDINQCLLEKRDTFTTDSNFLAWSRKVAFYKIQSYWRDKHRNRLLFDDELLNSMSETIDSLPDLYNEQIEALKSCINHLPADKQTMMQQRYGQFMPLKQIADYWGKSEKAISVMLLRIRLRLQDCIQKTLSARPRI
ncbi:sigma-70 family RNA polymerase sigma factor [Gimesia chilikensis]|uniref:RNA polymerase sigma factor n=1 Tax=Gimesia chilikensis TaxID=2605989 RepID=A0A517PWQ5_9PLAN|nr:sigma-70 family RNA polymerase sigma factor [Gimesia chilikensis]QDT23811.1 RNA polymerase sigma factor [Gimesia chilikensis]